MARSLDDRAGFDDPARPDLPGIDVFVSHVEEDGPVALRLADALEAAGYSTWTYERDTIPGPSYLLQTSRAIEASQAVVVLISPDSLGSHQVTSEVVRAHEEVKPFIPLLIGISREEFSVRQPEWREAIGSAATLELPVGGVDAVAPRIVEGLAALGVSPHPGGAPRASLSYAPAGVATPARASRGRRRLLVAGALVILLLAAVAAVLVLVLPGDEEPSSGTASPSPTTTASSSPTTSPTTSPSASPSQGTAVKDAATTPVKTAAGKARVTARVEREYCSIGLRTCKTAAPGRVFLVLEVRPWQAGDELVFNEKTSMSAFNVHITFQGVGNTPVETQLLDDGGPGFQSIYSTFPDDVAGSDVDLRWPGNPILRLHVKS
jgi:hypothetical protein